ncbi:MAG: hypothetical protein ACRDQ1_02055 [Sciscionella sp.]
MSSSSPAVPRVEERSAGEAIEAAADPSPRPVRRTFTAEYRARVVAKYEAAPRGSKAAVLRHERL